MLTPGPGASTVDFFYIEISSAVELTTGTMVLCLPATRQILVRYGPRLREYISSSFSSLPRFSISKPGSRKLSKTGKTDESGSDEFSLSSTKTRGKGGLDVEKLPPGHPARPRPTWKARWGAGKVPSRSHFVIPSLLEASAFHFSFPRSPSIPSQRSASATPRPPETAEVETEVETEVEEQAREREWEEPQEPPRAFRLVSARETMEPGDEEWQSCDESIVTKDSIA